MTDDKDKYPKGSRENPHVVEGSRSQAGLQAIIHRRGGPAPSDKEGKK